MRVKNNKKIIASGMRKILISKIGTNEFMVSSLFASDLFRIEINDEFIEVINDEYMESILFTNVFIYTKKDFFIFLKDLNLEIIFNICLIEDVFTHIEGVKFFNRDV